jgi:hypothetical protein
MEDQRISSSGSDGVSTDQFFDTLRSKHLAPEKALLLAILEDAIHCLEKYRAAQDSVGKERFHDAESWIMKRGNHWIFSFDNVCELLELDPQYVRQGLQKQSAKTARQAGSNRPGSRKEAA